MSIQIEQLSEEEREEIINYGIRRSIVISISTIVTIMAGYLLGIALQDKMVVGARGTITPAGLNVSENVTHLLEEGFAYVHLAPANNMLKENDFEKIIFVVW